METTRCASNSRGACVNLLEQTSRLVRCCFRNWYHVIVPFGTVPHVSRNWINVRDEVTINDWLKVEWDRVSFDDGAEYNNKENNISYNNIPDLGEYQASKMLNRFVYAIRNIEQTWILSRTGKWRMTGDRMRLGCSSTMEQRIFLVRRIRLEPLTSKTSKRTGREFTINGWLEVEWDRLSFDDGAMNIAVRRSRSWSDLDQTWSASNIKDVKLVGVCG